VLLPLRLFVSPVIRVLLYYRLGAVLYNKGRLLRIISSVFKYRLERTGIFFSYLANIGGGLRLPHPYGITIGEGVNIGRNVTIYQIVTLGVKKSGYPTIGDGVVIYAHSIVIGPIKIGDESIVGANTLVLDSVPTNSIVLGNPQKVAPIDGVGFEKEEAE
jgi:serine O-acetyltransferase